ncbi:MAG: zinc ribbon domain-containing protein [Clostridia bacterium]|nr:zinc ribbon domain-containing protein [Clostridia bacterium]
MRNCPKCGCENGDNFKFCCECGETLRAEETENISATDGTCEDDVKIFTAPVEDSQSTPCEQSVDTKTASVVETYDDENYEAQDVGSYDADDDEDSVDENDTEVVEERKKTSAEPDENTDEDEQRYVSQRRDDAVRRARRSNRRDNVRNDIIFIGVMVGLIAVIIGLSIIYINRNFPGKDFGERVRYIMTSSFTDALITRDPTIEPSETADGEPAVIITVYARKGCIVSFREGSTTMERKVEGQSIAFRVPTSLWTSSMSQEDIASVVIEPNVFVYDPDRSHDIVQLDFEPYSAALREVDITLTSPSTDEFTTSSTSVIIEGYVSDNEVAVFMNGKQLQLDENGAFRTVYHVTQEGKQKVVFTAQKSGYAIGSKVLIVNYNKSDIALEIYNEELRTFEDTLEIKGKIERGVELEVTGVEIDGEVEVSRYGEFAFTAKLPAVGNYAIMLNMKDGEKESAAEIYVERAPDIDEYMSSTVHFDYEWLLEHPTMEKHFGITGTVTEIYQTEPYVRAKLHTSDGDIVFTYYHTTEVATGDNKTYRIYGYPDGTDSETGLPQIYCWFIHKS